MRELELCAVGAASILQNPNGIPQTESDFKRQCEYLKESVDCFNDYAERCFTENHKLVADLFAGDLFKMEREFCTSGTDLRNNYTKHAVCFRNIQKKYQRSCMTDFQVGFETIHKLNNTIRLETACCNTNRLKECILPRIEEECGVEAVQLVGLYLTRAIGSMVSVICRNYDPLSARCQLLLPKVGTQPYNGRNTSAISRIISSYTNSVTTQTLG